MVFVITPAGTITKEQTLLSIRQLPIASATLITKGNVCELNSSGFLIVSPTSQTVGVEHFVALATVDNTGGGNAALTAPLAVRGHFVTAVADGVINPGDWVKISGTTAGRIIRWVPGTDNENLKVGIYWGKEGGSIAIAGSTPFAETFTDQEDFPPVVSAAGNVIEIELR